MEAETQKIVDQILHEAEASTESILQEARKSTEMMMEKQKNLARQNSKDEVLAIVRKGEDQAEASRRMIIADAKRKASWMMLSEKERLVTSVLDEVKNQLRAFSLSENYVPLLEKLIINAGIGLGGGKLEILLSEQDAILPLKLGMLIKAIVEKTGKEAEFKISTERIESLGGCVVRTDDKRVIIDNTFPAILKRRQKTLRSEIAKILFSK